MIEETERWLNRYEAVCGQDDSLEGEGVMGHANGLSVELKQSLVEKLNETSRAARTLAQQLSRPAR